MSDDTASGVRATARPAGLWEDFIDAFAGPAEVFERRRDGAYAGGLTMYGVAAALIFVASRAFWQPYFAHQMELGLAAQQAAGKLTPAQIEQARGSLERFAEVSTWIAGTVGTPLIVMLVAALVLGAARVVGARLSYGQSLVVATVAYVPRLVGTLAGAGVLAVRDPTTLAAGALPTSPAALLGPDASQLVAGLLGRLDPFVLWSTVLIAIGVAVLGRVPRSKGFAAAAIVWGVATLGAVLSALRAAAAANP